jgi:putative transposase
MSTHQQLLYHIIFSTKERRQLLKDDPFRDSVWSYMAGIASNLEGHALRIGGYIDHAHLLLRIPAKVAVSDFVRQLKANTSKHINDAHNGIMKFQWQDGYGAFTVSPSNRDAVIAYIDCQMKHHRKLTFQEEYLKMLANHEVEYDPKYLWE